MISIDIRDRNLLVTLTVPAKTPIRARSGSAYFYNSMELICVALGACFGGELVKLCSQHTVNPLVFESLSVNMENGIPILIVQHPKNLSQDLLNDIKYAATHCSVANMLKNQPELRLIENTIPVEILTDETKRSTCCGG
jgi:uncharacterized OsmC-like protein